MKLISNDILPPKPGSRSRAKQQILAAKPGKTYELKSPEDFKAARHHISNMRQIAYQAGLKLTAREIDPKTIHFSIIAVDPQED